MILAMTLTHQQRQAMLMTLVAGAEADGWSVSSAGYMYVALRRRKRNSLRRLIGLQYAAEQKDLSVDENGVITQRQHPELIRTRPRFQHDH